MYILNSVLNYFVRNTFRFLHLLVIFAVISITSLFTVSDLIINASHFRYFSSLNQSTEVWFANSPADADSFYNLNGVYFFELPNNTYLSTDILMQQNDSTYSNNYFGIKSSLENGTCLISQNVAFDNNLAIGSKIKTKSYTFTIKGYLPSEPGLDDKYNHEGILVLAYNELMVKGKEVKYLFFCSNQTTGLDVYKIVTLNQLKLKYKNLIIPNVFIFLGVYLIATGLTEFLFARKFKNKYLITLKEGSRKSHIFLNVFIDNVFKYVVPVVLTSFIFIKTIKSYTSSFLITTFTALLFSLIVSFAISLIYVLGGKRYVRK